jgi:hypothetical protein
MLPEAVVNVARNGIRVALDERREILGYEIPNLKAQFSLQGASIYGTPYLHAVKRRVASEFKIRANIAWQNWSRALSTQQTVPLADLRSTLISEIELPLRTDATSGDLAGHYHEAVRFIRGLSEPADTLDRMRQQAVEQITVEIDFAILAATKAQPAGSEAVTFNNYGSIGVVQTGAGSTASVQQSIGAAESETILLALDAVQKSLSAATELADRERVQIEEVVVEVRQELAKPQPNPLRVRGALTAVATTIQTLGSSAAAYTLVKGALALLGVHLP